jgi:hypothetical protein
MMAWAELYWLASYASDSPSMISAPSPGQRGGVQRHGHHVTGFLGIVLQVALIAAGLTLYSGGWAM